MDIDYQKMLYMIMDQLEYASLVDSEENIIYMSSKYCREGLDCEPQDVIGRKIGDVLPNTRVPDIMKGGKTVLGEYYLLENGMDTFANRFPLYDGEDLKGLFAQAIIFDVNDLVHMNMTVQYLKKQNETLRRELIDKYRDEYSLEQIVGVSEPIRQAKDLVRKFADSNLDVLITGETGVGKELFANALHYMSSRADKPFIKINCAAIPSELMESELFGYEKGAFTGASEKGKIGKLELANGGTVLLDEIGEMPIFMQSKLLRVLQERKLERIGGVSSTDLNIRVICSTNKDLKKSVKEEKFRSDLYYRINTVEIQIPPLRERKDDIELLCGFFIPRINDENGVFVSGISKSAIALLKECLWEGNVRELKHVLERACVSRGVGELDIKDFGFLLETMLGNSSIARNITNIEAVDNLSESVNDFEKKAIVKALVQTNGNKSKAAKLLGIDRTVLYSKLKKYQIDI